jgi:hypothetical protein
MIWTYSEDLAVAGNCEACTVCEFFTSTTKYTYIYILYTGAVEAGGLSEANKAASGGECVGWLRLLLLFLFVMTARRNCSSYSVV